MKRNIMIVLGVIVAILIILGIALAVKNMNTTPTSNENSGTTSSSTSSNNQQSSTGADKTAVLQTKTDGSLGKYLTDAAGHPLYTYGGDEQGVSNCTGQCLADWPAYTATTTSNLPANVTIITRSDGSKQYAYKGFALYTFIGDSSSAPTGDNVSNFHIAKP